MSPAVGKSGPFTILRSSSSATAGSSMTRMIALPISRRLCGGMLVAMPTAIPLTPFTSRFGMAAGNTDGSLRRSSKLGTKATVS